MTSARSLYNRASAVGRYHSRLYSICVECSRYSYRVLCWKTSQNSSTMSDAAAAPAVAPAKATKKRAGGAAKAKKHADHPKYSDMIKAAVAALKVCNLNFFALTCFCAKCFFPLLGAIR